MIAGQIAQAPPATDAQTQAIRLAIRDAWNDENDVFAGPSTFDITGDLHFTTNLEAGAVADRFFAAIRQAAYGGTEGRGPRLTSAAVNSAGSIITLSFDRTLSIPAGEYTPAAFAVRDGGTPVAIDSATRYSATQVRLTLASPAAGTVTVSFGEGASAVNATIPRSASAFSLPAETFSDAPCVVSDGVISVLEPEPGDILLAGVPFLIAWQSEQTSGAVTILLSRDDGESFSHTIATGIADDGEFTWTSAMEDLGAGRRLRIVDAADAGIFGDSGSFTIATASAARGVPVLGAGLIKGVL
jgi:hypothetical protein